MPISFTDFTWLFTWAQAPTWEVAWLLFVNVTWLFILWYLLSEVKGSWQDFVVEVSNTKRRTITLAIDVPRDAEQTPASMEAIFNQLAGAHGSANFWEQYWEGAFQEWFSFEIVSIEGYVQYVIWCNPVLRDLVEAAVYAQYPDAEITEIKDYTGLIPGDYPNETHKLWGAEFGLSKHEAFPLKTYNEFEDKVRGEIVDPMGALLEIMTKIGKGEQIWYQILAKPIVDSDWLPSAQSEVDKFLDKPIAPPADNMIQKVVGAPLKMIQMLQGGESEGPEDRSKDRIMSLTPGEKSTLEDMERKLSKLAFKCKLRLVYIGENNVFSKARGVGPAVGAIKQFNDMGKNNFRPSKKSWVKANYSFKKAREYLRMKNFYNGYKSRSFNFGIPGYTLSTEEMATLYHFPMASVKAPLVKRTASKKSEPPPVLPTDRLLEGKDVEIPDIQPTEPGAEPPELNEVIESANEGSTSSVAISDDEVTFVEIPDESSSNESASSDDEPPTSPLVNGPEPPSNLPV